MRSFLVALAFLTIVPVRFRETPAADMVARSRFWYPVVGVLLGAGLGFTAYGLSLITSPSLVAFLTLTLWVVATGALHLDGLADTCDGIFGGRDPEQRLKIMRDPHVGVFGIVGCTLVLLGKFVALQELASEPKRLVMSLPLAVVVARCGILILAGLSRYPRPEGTGRVVIEASRRRDALGAGVAALAVGYLLTPSAAWLATAAVCALPLLVVLLVTWLCHRRLGGVTGDCLGAAVELSELTCLLAYGLVQT